MTLKNEGRRRRAEHNFHIIYADNLSSPKTTCHLPFYFLLCFLFVSFCFHFSTPRLCLSFITAISFVFRLLSCLLNLQNLFPLWQNYFFPRAKKNDKHEFFEAFSITGTFHQLRFRGDLESQRILLARPPQSTLSPCATS